MDRLWDLSVILARQVQRLVHRENQTLRERSAGQELLPCLNAAARGSPRLVESIRYPGIYLYDFNWQSPTTAINR